MESNTMLAEQVRELAYRMTDGVEVTLLWSERDGRLTVTIFDERTGEFFELEAPREKALDVFYHPFSYAESNSTDAEMDLSTRPFSG
jgi:hypothetical protein